MFIFTAYLNILDVQALLEILYELRPARVNASDGCIEGKKRAAVLRNDYFFHTGLAFSRTCILHYI